MNDNRIIKYLKGAREELSKVTWPTKKQVTNHTLLVIAVSILVAAFLGVLDFVFSWGIANIL